MHDHFRRAEKVFRCAARVEIHSVRAAYAHEPLRAIDCLAERGAEGDWGGHGVSLHPPLEYVADAGAKAVVVLSERLQGAARPKQVGFERLPSALHGAHVPDSRHQDDPGVPSCLKVPTPEARVKVGKNSNVPRILQAQPAKTLQAGRLVHVYGNAQTAQQLVDTRIFGNVRDVKQVVAAYAVEGGVKEEVTELGGPSFDVDGKLPQPRVSPR
mmetsp:Transcript_3484/g.8969  ORF Transcript_3484/g.8969 Transcript_3484/m.8969 type:complete len:213 (-) Transcript_3484:425-1063(-)